MLLKKSTKISICKQTLQPIPPIKLDSFAAFAKHNAKVQTKLDLYTIF